MVCGPIAQVVEQQTFNLWVPGSSPGGPTIFRSIMRFRADADVSRRTLRDSGRRGGQHLLDCLRQLVLLVGLLLRPLGGALSAFAQTSICI